MIFLLSCVLITTEDFSERIDPDNDLILFGEDCDDLNNEIGAPVPWYFDADGDGFGSAETITYACEAPDADWIEDSSDCDDNDANVHPSADEICDNIDNNCDEIIDEDAIDQQYFYLDGDGDGYGDTESGYYACSQPDGYSADNRDCDDNNNTIHPSVDELCNGTDDNCDGQVDEEGAIDALTWYEDGDSDGFGDATETVSACAQPSGYVANDNDCNDSNDEIFSGATDIDNDGVDQDCDGTDFTDGICNDSCEYTHFMDDGVCDDGGNDAIYAACGIGSDCSDCGPRIDSDGDGHFEDNGGDIPENSLVVLDCDDSDESINPEAWDIPNDGIDQNCDGTDNTGVCLNTCSFANDGVCDDGGLGSDFAACDLGTDCSDCGLR